MWQLESYFVSGIEGTVNIDYRVAVGYYRGLANINIVRSKDLSLLLEIDLRSAKKNGLYTTLERFEGEENAGPQAIY